MKRSDVEPIKQYSDWKVNEKLSQDSLRKIHKIVDDNDVEKVREVCEGSDGLSPRLIECFAYALSIPNAHIASTILQKFPGNEKVKSIMVEDIAGGGALSVIKHWTPEQSKEYGAAYKVLEKDKKIANEPNYKLFNYTHLLSEILSYSLPIIWQAQGEAYQDKIWPQGTWNDGSPPLAGDTQFSETVDLKLLTTTAIKETLARQNTVFTTQPAKFMECFMEEAVRQPFRTRLQNAKDGKEVVEQSR